MIVRNGLRALAAALICGFVAARAEAQATRTWVSGVGDDVNPCSRTAPCKTWAGAISKTAAGGEIDALDPGGYGAVTITKSITLDGAGTMASILASGTTGVIVNAASTDVVILRNISINGAGPTPGLNGVRILAARQVHIQNCQIFGFLTSPARGISDERSAGQLFVDDTNVTNNGQSGIVLIPAVPAGATLHATLSNVRLERNGNAGLALTNGAKASVSRSVSSGNVGAGFYADGVGASTQLNLSDSSSVANGQGVNAQSGATVRITNMVITANATGLNIVAGTVASYGNNRIDGNTAGNGPPNATLTDQ